MKTSRFSSLLAAAVCAAGLPAVAFVSGCSTTPPTDSQVAAIQSACAVDAAVRPTVTALLAIPGLAKAEEVTAVVAARAVIDPICVKPSGTVQANAVAAITAASGQVIGIVTQLQARKASAPPATSLSTAAPSSSA